MTSLVRPSGRRHAFGVTSVLRTLVPVAFIAVSLSACVIEERGEARPAPRCRGAAWVEGHYGPRGVWHGGHWRCPGVVEVVEVD